VESRAGRPCNPGYRGFSGTPNRVPRAVGTLPVATTARHCAASTHAVPKSQTKPHTKHPEPAGSGEAHGPNERQGEEPIAWTSLSGGIGDGCTCRWRQLRSAIDALVSRHSGILHVMAAARSALGRRRVTIGTADRSR
jgi:hypothetical protein